jgi:tetratricopeptide (TPR) repeat protein
MTKRSLSWLISSGLIGSITLALPYTVRAQGQPARPVSPAASGSAGLASARSAASARPAASSLPAKVGAPGAAPSAAPSAAPAPAASNGLAPPTVTPAAAYAVPIARKVTPPAPPPTQEQLAALAALKVEADVYAKGAIDYSDTVTKIVKLHYQEKKKEILTGLDKDIAIERAELKKARDIAILRLEEFVHKYSGIHAQPEATPDAMYRLAALYEERARDTDSSDDLSTSLKPAIDLYKQVIREFPKYRELAGIYYFLGHAYNDSNRIAESQQVWRSLVCHNHYPYPTAPDPQKPDTDTVLPLPQDHDEAYWSEWRRAHYDEKSLQRGGRDTTYVDPYPSDCESIPQPAILPGEEPKYVAEIWWQLGNWEFDQLDQGGGFVKSEPSAVYDYNRAASAYSHSLQFKKPPLYGVALYKYAWALFKQQRYEASTREFVHLLNYTDQQQKETGDPGADFRGEAYTYIADSLTNLDFKGPAPSEPFIARPDIIDLEPRAAVAEQKLHVAIDRVKDPSIVPQDKPWTIEIYKALAGEFRSLNEFHNAIEIYQDILRKWPMDPTAPDVQNSVAETYDQLNATIHAGTPEHDQNAAKALEARTLLASYIGATPWTDANKDNPAALQNAERLVRGGLRQAAAQHTNNGKAQLIAAGQTGDAKEQVENLSRAVAEYKLAAIGWEGFYKQDENAPDAYESRYWLADAMHNEVRIEVLLHKLQRGQYPEPSPQDVDAAKAAAAGVRDSDEDDKYLENAAFFVVDESDIGRDLEYQRYDDTHGSSGVEHRASVKFDGSDPETRKVIVDPIPGVIQASMAAREEYVQRVPPNVDTSHRAMDYQWYAAETLFLYGHFDEAKARFEPMYRDHCGKDEYGYKAWEKLISMSNITRDAERSRQLAEAEKNHSCAVNEEQKGAAELIVKPTIQAAFYQDAAKVFKQAQDTPSGAAKDALWRKAAGMYEAALLAAPARDEAPEAAINGAYAYKQVGEFGKAIGMYDKFISEYGSNERLTALQKGDGKNAPDLKKYETRLQFLGQAYDALSTTYYGFFNYQKAAETYEKIGANQRFDESKRKDAARNAMLLYASMGQRAKATSNYHTLVSLHPTADEKANADFLVADYDHKQWSATAPDTGQNREARQSAEAALAAFYASNRNNSAASKYSLQAAYWIFKMKKVAGDPSYRAAATTAVAAWESFRAHGPSKDGKGQASTAPFSDYGAEAQFALVDDQIHKDYDIETGHHKYAGSVPDIIGSANKAGQVTPGKYQKDAVLAQKYDDELEQIVKTYPSQEWVPATIARQGSVYDALRTGLYNAVPPAVHYFTPAQEALLKRLEGSGISKLQDQADDLRTNVKEGWRKKKEVELAGADEVMVKRYATAVAYARKYNVRNAQVTHAIERLAYFTDIIGNDKMREYVTRTKDPTDLSGSSNLSYSDGMYLQARPGLTATPPDTGEGPPAPVAP